MTPPSPDAGRLSPDMCKHTVVRVVSRSDDGEFVECQSCGEIFDSIEYEDMAREEALRAAGDEEPEVPVRAPGGKKAAKGSGGKRR